MTDRVAAARGPRRRLPRRALIISGVVVVVLAGVAALAYGLGHRPTDPTLDRPTRTAQVERTSLAAGFVLSGTLGYGTVQDLGGGGGVVTRVPTAGQVIMAGNVLMEIEGSPVFLLQGDLPLWRTIGPGTVGIDVEAVRSALAGLGLNAGAGQTYDPTLSEAIAQLYARAGYAAPIPQAEDKATRAAAQEGLTAAQAALATAQQALTAAQSAGPSQADKVAADNDVRAAERGLNAARAGDCSEFSPTGTCGAGAVAAAEDALALAKVKRAELDRPPNTTAETRAVADARTAVQEAQRAYDQSVLNTVGPKSVLLVPGDRIRIDEVKAKVGLEATGTVVTWTQTNLYGRVELTDAQRRLIATGTSARLALPDGKELAGSVGQITEPTQDPQTREKKSAVARIDIADQAALAELGPTAVTVSFIQDEAEDTLVVPVTALMVLAEGGYCVERAEGGLVEVKLGLIADTRAQIFSDELGEGDLVVVP
jgi:hypothetical protein